MTDDRAALASWILTQARQQGLDLAGVVPAASPMTASYYEAWLQSGYHGDMAYLGRPDAIAKRCNLDQILPGVRSVLMVGVNYHSNAPPAELKDDPARGLIASYAWGRDYHDVLVPRLRHLGELVGAEIGHPVTCRAYSDTGPILERELATRAGLGFVGKNTNLIHPRFGSWLFLGELLLSVELPAMGPVQHVTQRVPARRSVVRAVPVGFPADSPRLQQRDVCGQCTRCLDACPTNAFAAPRVLDARRCISYLTIELKGAIPRALRPLMGNRIFGCDVCQDVCPWNRRFARPTSDPAFEPRTDGMVPRLLDLITLDEEGFRQRFRDTPIRRTKRRGLLRNVAVALGNWGDALAVPALVRTLHDVEPLVRGHAAWALGRIATDAAKHALRERLDIESEPWVRDELQQALLP